jgi:hypothetical protein
MQWYLIRHAEYSVEAQVQYFKHFLLLVLVTTVVCKQQQSVMSESVIWIKNSWRQLCFCLNSYNFFHGKALTEFLALWFTLLTIKPYPFCMANSCHAAPPPPPKCVQHLRGLLLLTSAFYPFSFSILSWMLLNLTPNKNGICRSETKHSRRTAAN